MGQEASKALPCPGCGKTDWCFHISEDAFVCGRINEAPEGYRKTGEGKDGRGIFARIESKRQRINLGEILPLKTDPVSPDDLPQWECMNPDAADGFEYEVQYPYFLPGDTLPSLIVKRRQWFDRRPYPDGKTKQIRPWHLAEITDTMRAKGCERWWVEGRGVNPWPLYNQRVAEDLIVNHGQNVLFYVAGEQAVDTASQIGLTAITNPGGEGTAIAQVRDWLAELEVKPALFVIWPDHDEPGAAAAERLRQACNFVVPTLVLDPLEVWPEMPNKGDVTDYWQHLKENYQNWDDTAIAAIEAAIENAHKRLNLNIRDNTTDDTHFGVRPCTLAYRLEQCEAVLGKRIRLNTLTNELELDGKPCDVSELRLIVAKRHNIETSLQDLEAIASAIGRANQYNPVMDYLDQVAKMPVDRAILDNLASRYFGSDEPIHQVMVKKFLIAAVARIYRPGVKVDNVLFLSGPQAYRKSTFFRRLAGHDWFDDSMGAMGDKDEVLKLHRVWFVEWAELETVFKRKEVAAVKAFLTCSSDSLRRPYGRVVERMPRRSVIVGTTNETDILKDSTGNRRYWVIPVKKLIDTDLLEKERDQIWAAAVQLYRAGDIWYLTNDEEKLAEASRETFTADDVWDEAIIEYLADHNGVTTTEILSDCMRIDLALQDRKQQMRVNEIMKRLGYSQKLKRFEGVVKRIWLKSEDLLQIEGGGCYENPETLNQSGVLAVTTSVTVKNNQNNGNPTSPTTGGLRGVTENVTDKTGVVTDLGRDAENSQKTSVTPSVTGSPQGFEGNSGDSEKTSVTEVVTAETLTGQGLQDGCNSVTVKNAFSQTISTDQGSEKIKPGDIVLITASARIQAREIPKTLRHLGCPAAGTVSQDVLSREMFNELREFFTVVADKGHILKLKPVKDSNIRFLLIKTADCVKWEGPINE